MHEMDDTDSDIDDSYEESHIPDTAVQGVILVQLLVLSQFNDESCSIYDNVYLQLACSKYVKRTHVIPFYTHKEAIIDAVKHFPVNIPVSKAALKNINLKIEMIMYKANKDRSISIDKRQMGVMLFHLKDIMNNRVVTGTHEFSKDMTSMAKLELKICFTAGMFGFGYSRRINFEADSLEDEFPVNLEEQLLLSLFPRYKPPPDRVDESRGGILSVKEIPVPDILPLFHDPDDPAGNKFLYESKWTNHPCASLMKDCARLRRLRLILLTCDSYHLRRIFLEKLILNNQEMSFADIKYYQAQKEEDTDNLNCLMEQAEKYGSIAEPGFQRRMSSSVNPVDIKDMLERADKKMKETREENSDEDNESTSSSKSDSERRIADDNIEGSLNTQNRWARIRQFTLKTKQPASDPDC